MSVAESCELRLGDWRTALADVGEVDAVITDPPYSRRTHDGHFDGVSGTDRQPISYAFWRRDDIFEFVHGWKDRNRGWFVCLSDHSLCHDYEDAFADIGLTTFAPVACVISGMTVRLAGDGPSSWVVYANVARPKALCRWGTLPGAYVGPAADRVHIGGKPLWLMHALVRDYSEPGDLVCDPCAGGATTLLAARAERRRAIGAELDPKTHALAMTRLRRGYTPTMFAEGC